MKKIVLIAAISSMVSVAGASDLDKCVFSYKNLSEHIVKLGLYAKNKMIDDYKVTVPQAKRWAVDVRTYCDGIDGEVFRKAIGDADRVLSLD